MMQIHNYQEPVPDFPRRATGSWTKRVSPDEIPESEDLFSAEALEERLGGLGESRLSVLAGGDAEENPAGIIADVAGAGA